MNRETNLLTSKIAQSHSLVIVGAFSILLSLIPVFYTWGRLNVGGDVMVPVGVDGFEKYLYHWLSMGGGQYFAINYYPLYLFYKGLELFGLDIYQIASVLYFLLGITAAFGIYKICVLFSGRERPYVYFVPIFFYMISPALLNGWHYNFIYAFTPLFVYFVFKIVKQRDIGISDVLWINVVFFFCTTELPNPKYIFHLNFIAILILLGSFSIGLIDVSFFKRNWKKFAIHVLLLSYILLPTAYFVTQYQPQDYGVQIKAGYTSTGPMMNYGVDTIDRVLKLHQEQVFLNYKDAAQYNNNVLVKFLSFVFIFVIVMSTFFLRDKTRQNKQYQLILLSLVLIYIFFGAGPNPPFGFIYEYLVTTFPLLAFLRTTGGAVFYLSLFYAIILFTFLANFKKYRGISTLFILSVISIVSYPFLNGDYYKNFNAVNQYTNIEKRGYQIPDAYFRIKNKLDSLRLDANVLYPSSNLTYLNTRWGFFGPIIYNFIYNTRNIGYDKVLGNLAFHNVGFIYQDSSLLASAQNNSIVSTPIIKDEFIDVSRLSRDKFLPHFYTPTNLILSSDPVDVETLTELVSSRDLPLRTVILSSSNYSATNIVDLNSTRTPQLEFRRINATKYRARIHGAKTIFPLVFSENFHSGWKAYPMRIWKAENGMRNLTNYKILYGNDEDRATAVEIKDYLRRGWISTLGDGQEKVFQHKKWETGREIPTYSENYHTEFISKKFQDTIQNDNLPSGSFYETWLKNPLPETVHFTANGYANGWILETEQICRSAPTVCVRNSNGTYDLELIVEFWPQKLYYLSILISITTLLSCLGYLLYRTIHKNQMNT